MRVADGPPHSPTDERFHEATSVKLLLFFVKSSMSGALGGALDTLFSLFPAAVVAAVLAVAVMTAIWASTQYERFPYKCEQQEQSTALFAGSLNPPHHGHMAIIEHLARKHAVVHVVIGVNASKTYAVPSSQRKEIVEQMCASAQLDNVIVEVTSDYIWRLARKVHGIVLYRGIRTWRKDGPPERWLELLNLIGPPLLAPLGWPLRTAYLQADPRFAHVSSSLVRKRCQQSEPISDLVPAAIAESVRRAYG